MSMCAVGMKPIVFAQAIIVKFVAFPFVLPIAEMNTVREQEPPQIEKPPFVCCASTPLRKEKNSAKMLTIGSKMGKELNGLTANFHIPKNHSPQKP